jgi:aryl-alcohol dehydrogenase
MRVTAAVTEEKSGAFRLDSLELDVPRPDEVLVAITATGICHTDLHARDGYFAMPYPAVYSHEGAGVVAAVGNAVEHLAAGDHVVISFPWCGECEHCREDRRSYCQRGRELKSAGTRADGSTILQRNRAPVYGSFFQQSSFATHVLTPARDVFKVRRDAPLEFLGPLGCGLQTGAGAVLNVMQPEAGKSFAVFGAGSVGLAGLMAAKGRWLRADHRRRHPHQPARTRRGARGYPYDRQCSGGCRHEDPANHRRPRPFHARNFGSPGGVSSSSRLPPDTRHLRSCGQRSARH